MLVARQEHESYRLCYQRPWSAEANKDRDRIANSCEYKVGRNMRLQKCDLHIENTASIFNPTRRA